LPQNTRLGQKRLAVTNALAYNNNYNYKKLYSSGTYNERSKWTHFWSRLLALCSNYNLVCLSLSAYNTVMIISDKKLYSSGPYDARSKWSPFWSRLLALPSTYKPRTVVASSDKHTSLAIIITAIECFIV
jgi:hypothetical protein